jgi:hypothetical protein
VRSGSTIAAAASGLRVFSLRELTVHRRRTIASIAVMAVSAMYLVAVLGIFGALKDAVTRPVEQLSQTHPVKCSRITSIGRSGLTNRYDQGKSNHHCTSVPPAGHAKVSAFADDQERDVLVGYGRKRGQPLPAAPAGRFRLTRADDLADLRVQAIRTDQQIALGRTAVVEFGAHAMLRTDHVDHTGVEPDPVARKAVQQPVENGSPRDHSNRCAEPVCDRGQVQGDQRAARRRHDTHAGEQLTGPVHVDVQLLQNHRTVGPDGDGSATCSRIRSPVEDGDVVSVPQ